MKTLTLRRDGPWGIECAEGDHEACGATSRECVCGCHTTPWPFPCEENPEPAHP